VRNITVAGLVFAAIFSFTACDEEGSTTPTLGRTPAQVLGALERAFQERDAELLGGLIDTDFTFYFARVDIGTVVDGYEIPPTWGREDMLAACGNMITEAYSIDISIAISQVGDPEEGSTEYVANNVCIDLLVMFDATSGARTTGFCYFGFVNDDSAGYDDWVITDWWDKTAFYGTYGLENEEKSLGTILAMFI
jgi:hypothetical protein